VEDLALKWKWLRAKMTENLSIEIHAMTARDATYNTTPIAKRSMNFLSYWPGSFQRDLKFSMTHITNAKEESLPRVYLIGIPTGDKVHAY
jgi:hypothetical protein